MRDVLGRVILGILSGKQLKQSIHDENLTIGQFFSNLVKHEDLQNEYKRARQIKADLFADDIVGIADNKDIDPTRARNMIEARKWVASKYHPKIYGDKIDIEVTKTVDIGDAIEAARKRAIEARVTHVLDKSVIKEDIISVDSSPVNDTGPLPDIFD